MREEPTTDVRFQLQCLAATAVIAASFALTRRDYRPEVLLQVATEFNEQEALRRREIKRVTFKGDVQELRLAQRRLRASAKTTAPTTEQMKQFNTIAAPMLNLLPEIPTLLHNQDILQEESEMAWWVLAGFSRRAGHAFRELPPAFLPIVLASELAERTRIFPSGVAARHLIAHVIHTVGRDDSAVSLPALAHTLPEAWTSATLKITPSIAPTITPLLYLLEQQSARGEHWAKQYQFMTGIDSASELPASQLGYTFYQECLVSRLRSEA